MIYKIYLKTSRFDSIPSYIKFIKKFFLKKNIKIVVQYMPTKIHRISLLRSPHVYKKSKDHFEAKIFQAVIIVKDTDLNILKFILNQKPIGIASKIILSV